MTPKLAMNLLSLLAIMFFFSPSNAQSTNKYTYYAYDSTGSKSEIVIDEAKSAVYLGHAGRGASFCDRKNELYCVKSPMFEFSVPKGDISVGMKWSHWDSSFSITDADTIDLLGEKLEFFTVVRKEGNGETSSFFYSPDRGLIGFSLPNENASITYFSSSYYGFPMNK